MDQSTVSCPEPTEEMRGPLPGSAHPEPVEGAPSHTHTPTFNRGKTLRCMPITECHNRRGQKNTLLRDGCRVKKTTTHARTFPRRPSTSTGAVDRTYPRPPKWTRTYRCGTVPDSDRLPLLRPSRNFTYPDRHPRHIFTFSNARPLGRTCHIITQRHGLVNIGGYSEYITLRSERHPGKLSSATNTTCEGTWCRFGPRGDAIVGASECAHDLPFSGCGAPEIKDAYAIVFDRTQFIFTGVESPILSDNEPLLLTCVRQPSFIAPFEIAVAKRIVLHVDFDVEGA